jgi:DnaD/phage-associated family protein
MSALVMGLVWELQETAEFGRPEKYVLLAYADHADSAGRNIYPSVDLVASKTFYEERAVQIITRKLQKAGYLVPDGVGPHGTNRWFIPIKYTPEGGAKIAPVQKADLKNAPEGNAPEPSVVVKPVVVVVKKGEGEIFAAYESEIGPLTPAISDAISAWLDDDQVPPSWIADAIHIAAISNKRSWKYIEGILKNWKAHGKEEKTTKTGGSHANNRSGSVKRPTAPKSAPVYSDADRAAADAINQKM